MANGGGDYIAPQFQMRNVEGLVPGMVSSRKKACWMGADHSADATYGCFEGTDDASNYSTAVIGNGVCPFVLLAGSPPCTPPSTSPHMASPTNRPVSMAWIRKVVEEDSERPFFAYIAPKVRPQPRTQSHGSI